MGGWMGGWTERTDGRNVDEMALPLQTFATPVVSCVLICSRRATHEVFCLDAEGTVVGSMH